MTTFRKFAAGAALAMLAVLPACAFPGGGTAIGTGDFNGVSISGPDADSCTSSQPDDDHLVVRCSVVQSLIGDDVYISFANKGFNAHVQLDASPFGVEWAERLNAGPFPPPSNSGVITGSQSADLTGGTVARDTWVLGLECSDSQSGAEADVLVTITRR